MELLKSILISLLLWNVALAQTYVPAWKPLSRDEVRLSQSTHLIFEADSANGFLRYRGYVVKYDNTLHSPKYTIHQLTPKQIDSQAGTKAKRLSTFLIDTDNLSGFSATNADYKNSGWDRGHMVPAGDFYWNVEFKNETFLYSNISPQQPNLNRGIWANLEEAIRRKVLQIDDTAYVITGAIYQPNGEVIGPDHVAVPSHIYKIVFFPDQERIYAFLFDNGVATFEGSLNQFQVSVDDLEVIAGEDFFEVLEDSIEVRLEKATQVFDGY